MALEVLPSSALSPWEPLAGTEGLTNRWVDGWED